MSKTAKIFRNGNSQAVRLPQEFRFPGNEVRIRREGDAVVLEPMITNPREWFAAIDRYAGSDAFEGNWRDQRKARLGSVLEEADELHARHQRLRRGTAQPATKRKKPR
ncbi:MAG TPA: type II toxin-antitoxin system VapB family antitoxin [Terriglobales bacterium]|nr:type II toxin-antitoxin system VapB family antitoxin [Terriglobales bacterium]